MRGGVYINKIPGDILKKVALIMAADRVLNDAKDMGFKMGFDQYEVDAYVCKGYTGVGEMINSWGAKEKDGKLPDVKDLIKLLDEMDRSDASQVLKEHYSSLC